LKRYILSHRCDACDATPGRCHHKVKATTKAKHKTKSTSKTVAPVATAIAPAVESPNPPIEHLDLDSTQSQMPLTPLLQLNPWHVFFSTRQITLLTILKLLRCVRCQTLLKTLLKAFCRCAPFLATIPPLVKALQLQAPILRHLFSHRPALICT